MTTNKESPNLEEDRRFLAMAIDEAKLSGTDIPVGAVIVFDNQVIAKGHNEREISNDPTAHAELIAIRQAAQHQKSWRLNGCTLYTTLEPCAMCAEAIIQSRVSRVVFGAYDVLSGACGSAFNLFVGKRIYPIPELLGGIAHDECKALLVDFFREKKDR